MAVVAPAVRRWGAGVQRLIRDRVALLRLLGVVSPVRRFLVATAMVVVSVLPALTAIAVAWLVDRIVHASATGESVTAAVVPLAVVGLLLTLDQVGQSLIVPFRNWMAALVNGAIRRSVRQAVSARPGIDHLESQVVRDAAALPVENEYLFNLGAGAEGQLWLMARFAGAIAAALVVARVSVPAAVATFWFVAWQRSCLRRHYAGAIAGGMVDTTSDGRAATYWSEVLSTPGAGKELRLFGFRSFALERFHAHGKRPVEELSRVLLGARSLHRTIFLLNALAAAIPIVILARAAIDGSVGPALLTAALGGVVAVARVLGPMGFEAFSIEAAVPQLAAVESLRAFHHEEQERRRRRPGANRDASGIPEIRFEAVSFSYPNAHQPVLHDLDLVLRPGESVALVGENGIGKTTLLKLLSGFYAPTAGRILVDGVPLDDLDPEEWRTRLAVIFQDFTRFELSAFENVALADLGHPDARAFAVAAAEAASARQLITALPNGWDTVLSRAFTGGVDLSGGQWQRIALARALYATKVGGQVLILDEPTASLDVSAELALFDQLLTHAAGCTAIVVSHRFSTVRRAARIVVLADGHVVEDGSHDDLIAANGRYAHLYELQARRFREPSATDAEPSDPMPEGAS